MKSLIDKQTAVLAALAHPNRIRIVDYLRKDNKCNCEIAPALGLEQSNLSRHLKILVQAGVLESWKEGLRVNYKIADERVLRIIETAGSLVRQEARAMAEAVGD